MPLTSTDDDDIVRLLGSREAASRDPRTGGADEGLAQGDGWGFSSSARWRARRGTGHSPWTKTSKGGKAWRWLDGEVVDAGQSAAAAGLPRRRRSTRYRKLLMFQLFGSASQ